MERFPSVAALSLFAIGFLTLAALAQNSADRLATLPEDRFKNGNLTLNALSPLAEATRYSIAKFDLNGSTVALGAIIDRNGLAITKASEIKEGKLTCWLPKGREVGAQLLAVDADNDVALVKINATGFKPIQWALEDAVVGQWAVTPGIEAAPMAIGVISVPPRRILPKRAMIGVDLDFNSTAATLAAVTPGFGADKAGLKSGDVILAVNDSPVNDRTNLVNMLREFREGQTVKLRVKREQEEFDALVQLTAESVVLAARFGQGGGGFGGRGRSEPMAGPRSERAEDFEVVIQHDTVLQPWQCGGPLVNLEGKAIGLNIARAGRVATYSLPAALLKRIIENLKTQAAQQ